MRTDDNIDDGSAPVIGVAGSGGGSGNGNGAGTGAGTGSGSTARSSSPITPDAPTMLGLAAEIVRPPFLAFLDFDGDPIRVTTWETSLRFADTGDTDLDGETFTAISPQFVSVSPVKRQTGGSDTVTATLSGIVGPDSDLLDLLGDATKWRTRLARFWFLLKNEDGTDVGGVVAYLTGRMVGFKIHGEATSQTAIVTVETYLAALSDASNRTWLDQADFDPNDTSAALTIACANGAAAQR